MLDSLNKYLTSLEAPTLSIINVRPDFIWGNNLVDTKFPSAVNPVFRIELQLDAHGGVYLTDLLNFQVNNISNPLNLKKYYYYLYYLFDGLTIILENYH